MMDKSTIGKTIMVIWLAVLSFPICMGQESSDKVYDLVIYGGTPAGIVSAVQASRMGQSSVLIVTNNRLGGAMSGGLGQSDIGIKQSIGGISKEFFERVYEYYQQDSAWVFEKRQDYKPRGGDHTLKNGDPMYTFEPKVARSIFEKMIDDAGNITIVYNERLAQDNGIITDSGRIRSLNTESGKSLRGKYYIDATYEGDMMAQAGVSYHVGRESRDTYKESLAGVLGPAVHVNQPKQFFANGVSPYDNDGNLLPKIQDGPMGSPGDGDHKIQAYNFRICLTTTPENKVPIPKPENYDVSDYELLYREIKASGITSIFDLFGFSPMPNNKTDINDGGPFSTDYIGANWDYPEADYRRRDEIWRDHYDFTVGMLYFLGHDSRLPASIRNGMLAYGLPKDEYTETNHWSPQLYVRETRRMIGQDILVQQDCQEQTTKKESIGLASYGPDSHHVQRIVLDDGKVINEGNFLEPHKLYEIPLGIVLPKKEECTNLLVPVCVSSSHIAFGSIRMEPVFMIMGQSAATVACMAIQQGMDIHDLDYKDIRRRLKMDRQKIKLREAN